MIVRAGLAGDGARALAIWRAAVDATHGFLSAQDRVEIDAIVAGFLPAVPLWLAVDDDDMPLGFMVFDCQRIEALFVDPACHGRGIGSRLIAHALRLSDGPVLVDANEQADNALPFYLARGFTVIGRSPRDSDGRPYPIIHLQHPNEGQDS